MEQEKLDRLLYHGKIHTLKTEGDVVEALGIRAGKIVFVGSSQDALRRFSADEAIDLNGRTVIPGLGDSHMHFNAACQALATVDLSPCRSKADALDRLRKKAQITPKGEWIRGSGFDQSKWEDAPDQLPSRHDLDAVSIEHPIVIKRACLHTAVANTAALQKAGLFQRKAPESGGMIEFEADGLPNGVLREQSIRIFDVLIPNPLADPFARRACMAEQLKRMASLGMTSMHTYAADVWQYAEDPSDYACLDREGLLPLRVTVYQDDLAKLAKDRAAIPAPSGDPSQKLSVGGYKLFCDGSLGSRSAALYAPYSDDPSTSGMLVQDPGALEEKMFLASRQGVQCAIHAIGDYALDVVLTAIEHTRARLKAAGWSASQIDALPKFRIIHAQLATPDLIRRMQKLPLVLDVQPAFFLTDMHWVHERLGPARMENGYLWRTYMESGLLLTGGSDAPVEPCDPMPAIYSAVTREDFAGRPRGGLQPREKLSVAQALCLFTRNLPYATGTAHLVGTLEVGKFADLAVLDRDLFSIQPREILEVQVERTMLAGTDTWVRA